MKDMKLLDAEGELIDFAVMFPGQEVTLPEPLDDVKVTVWPASVSQMRRFSEAISRFVARISIIQFSESMSNEARMAHLIPHILPAVLDELIDLVNECTVGIDLTSERLPHWVCAPCVQAWLEETWMGEGKVEPWMTALKEGLDFIGQGANRATQGFASTSETPSKPSSSLDTASKSSSDSNGETGAPTEAGPSPSTTTSPDALPAPA